MDLKVVFQPDHTSELYADTMHMTMVSNEKNSRTIHLSGKSRTNNMYVRGVELLSGNMSNESMVLVDLEDGELGGVGTVGEEKDEKKTRAAAVDNKQQGNKSDMAIPTAILVTLYALPSPKTSGEYLQAEKLIFIGCMRTTGEKKDVKRVSQTISLLKF